MLREMIPESDMDCVAEMETQCFSDPWTPEMILDSFRTGLDTWLILEEEEARILCLPYDCRRGGTAPDRRASAF